MSFQGPGSADHAVPRFRISIAAALMSCFGGLMFVGVSAALGLGFWTATVNTGALLGDKASLSMELMSTRLRNHFDSVAAGNRFLAKMILDGRVDVRNTETLIRHLRVTMAATPQVLGMGFFYPDETVIRVGRDPDRTDVGRGAVERTPQMARALREIRARDGSFWGSLVFARRVGATLINLRTPIRRDGEFIGALVSVVSVAELSRFVAELSGTVGQINPFILYGDHHVLAHRTMSSGEYPRSAEYPIPRLDQVGDPILARIWDSSRQAPRLVRLSRGLEGHVVRANGTGYIYFLRRVSGYDGLPLIVGAYVLPESGLTDEFDRLFAAGGIALLVTLLTVAASLFLARRMSRPVRALAAAARRIGEMRLEGAPDLPRIRLRDLDEAAAAFNVMMRGLRWFETYVPRKLVRGLMAQGATSDVRSEEREVTVMFTDIAGFTALAQTMTAADTAALLNAHFSLLADCIEAEDGTVDKYIGDSVMAFWGPPFGESDHALRACRAALAIRAAIERENARRTANGDPSIGLRIGLHSGTAIVGNIGAPGRINYTLVGDTVNVAQRLEQFGKRPDFAEQTVPILLSRDVVGALGESPLETALLTPRGAHELPGRSGAMDVYSLD